MAPRDSIGHAICSARERGGPALVAYITAGFPKKESFRELLGAVARTADLVEVGVPFTDPMADGTTIQRSSRASLEQGVSLKWILAELEAFSNEAPAGAERRAPLLLMSYLNPLLAFGIERLPDAAAKAGVAGFIVPDLPYEECDTLRAALDARGIALVQFVTPVTPLDRVKMLSANSSGFLYAVTMTGTTGKNVEVPPEVFEYFARVKEVSPVPVCAGFGIRSRAQVAKLAPHVDGVIVGSALVETLERGEDPSAFLQSLR
jgi:tryptophan synthase alpha chain